MPGGLEKIHKLIMGGHYSVVNNKYPLLFVYFITEGQKLCNQTPKPVLYMSKVLK